MATFPNYNPIFPATKRINPQTRVTAFNDGYQHRISFGLNQNPQIWNLTFNLDELRSIKYAYHFFFRNLI